MFRRAHHRRIVGLLSSMNAAFLAETQCCFGGGTCAALLLGEYRESVDMGFLCSHAPGDRDLRNTVTNLSLGELFLTPPTLLREVRADRYGIRTILAVEDVPIKFEIVLEGRVSLQCESVALLPVPILDRASQMVEKLLANSDRSADRSVCARDLIDLTMMIEHWGEPGAEVWERAEGAYGPAVRADLEKARKVFQEDPGFLDACLARLDVSRDAQALIRRRFAGVGE
ncbi:nucleotidyl transferase AbiEii/AbiGii toxin family protein [uncultured Thiocystis sp.]|jgi:hypothetical protein|uniref:nucleotidyl transferase AbiEii/AbiGii toxin family protein n=1 Tax=uncultured Thiocystis sp. TaxID=1202134 RepID=UPI0025CD7177|nr:nucleotidyl transferase AbiEii/AbiGii toxin family protein [uncultured Thiocystis sp.]